MMADLSKWKPLIQKTNDKLLSVLTHLNKVWEEIGYSEERSLHYCEQTYSHIEEMLNEMISEAERHKQSLLEKIKQLMKQISGLSKELGTNVDTNDYVHLPLKEVEQLLCTDLQKLQCQKEQRIKLFRELLTEEEGTCKILGIQPIQNDVCLPSEEELNDFALYLEQIKAKKNNLESEFKNIRKNIVQMMGDLGTLPASNFEDLVCTYPEKFIFSTINMRRLKELRDQLKVQVEEMKERVEEMKDELIKLWRFLEEPEETCKSFLSSINGYNNAVINVLSTEIKLCKEKQEKNIFKIITRMRIELEKLWNLCKYDESQRQKFVPFYSNNYTVDLLTLHELEVQKLQKFYDTHKFIFEKLEEHRSLLQRMNELLKRAQDPNRFQNRGGQLLVEEKERKTIQKQLPKIEEQLRNLVQEYETTHGETFRVDGATVDELLQELRNGLNEEGKKGKKDTKDKSTKKVTLSSSKKAALNSSKKTTLNSSKKTALHAFKKTTLNECKKSPGIIGMRVNTSKRKLLFNPPTSGSAKRKNLNAANESKPVKKVSQRLMYSEKKVADGDSQKENKCTPCTSAVLDTTYEKFKRNLKDTGLCSSLLPEERQKY